MNELRNQKERVCISNLKPEDLENFKLGNKNETVQKSESLQYRPGIKKVNVEDDYIKSYNMTNSILTNMQLHHVKQEHKIDKKTIYHKITHFENMNDIDKHIEKLRHKATLVSQASMKNLKRKRVKKKSLATTTQDFQQDEQEEEEMEQALQSVRQKVGQGLQKLMENYKQKAVTEFLIRNQQVFKAAVSRHELTQSRRANLKKELAIKLSLSPRKTHTVPVNKVKMALKQTTEEQELKIQKISSISAGFDKSQRAPTVQFASTQDDKQKEEEENEESLRKQTMAERVIINKQIKDQEHLANLQNTYKMKHRQLTQSISNSLKTDGINKFFIEKYCNTVRFNNSNSKTSKLVKKMKHRVIQDPKSGESSPTQIEQSITRREKLKHHRISKSLVEKILDDNEEQDAKMEQILSKIFHTNSANQQRKAIEKQKKNQMKTPIKQKVTSVDTKINLANSATKRAKFPQLAKQVQSLAVAADLINARMEMDPLAEESEFIKQKKQEIDELKEYIRRKTLQKLEAGLSLSSDDEDFDIV